MNTMLRILAFTGVGALAVLAIAIGLARNTAALAAPAHVLLFAAVVALYLAPSVLALHRNCVASGWIIALNVLLGWTLFGWAAALVWAAAGKVAAVGTVRPVAGH